MGDGASVDAGRRRLLLGSVGLVGVVLLGGCNDQAGDSGNSPGTTAGGGNNGVTTSADQMSGGDVDLLSAAGVLEQQLADTYAAVLAARPDELAYFGLADRVALHRDHHDSHASALDTLAGPAEPGLVLPRMVLPTADELAHEPVGQLVTDLRHLEDVLAQTYLDAVARLSQPTLRGLASSIGAAEAGHAVSLDLALALGVAGYDPAATPDGTYPVDSSALEG